MLIYILVLTYYFFYLENDLITLSNDSDVLLALQNSKILKLTIFCKYIE
jgi:hypothetical protein